MIIINEIADKTQDEPGTASVGNQAELSKFLMESENDHSIDDRKQFRGDQ